MNPVKIERALRAASGEQRVLGMPAPAQISAREAATWLDVSHPTAAKLLRGVIAPRRNETLVPITALASLASPVPLPPRPHRILVASTAHHWARTAIASGLAQGLGLLGAPSMLRDTDYAGVRERFGGLWPGARLATGAIAPTGGVFAVIGQDDWTEDASPDLVLVPYPDDRRGYLDAAETLHHLPARMSGEVRLLPWKRTSQQEIDHGLGSVTWPILPRLDVLVRYPAPLPPLFAMPEGVPSRPAMALRVALAHLCWQVLEFLDQRR